MTRRPHHPFAPALDGCKRGRGPEGELVSAFDRSDLNELTVLTNGIKIALLLEAAHPRFTIVVTGGTLRRTQHSLENSASSGLK